MAAAKELQKRLIPKRLEEELNNLPKFNVVSKHADAKRISEVMAHSKEKQMYDEILGPILNKRNTNDRPNTNINTEAGNQKGGITTSENDSSNFNVSVLSRLADVEAEKKLIRRQLVESLRRIDELEVENKSLLEFNEDASVFADELKSCKSENNALKKQIKDMEKFLLDYGLVWVGEDAPYAGSSAVNSTDNSTVNSIRKDGVDFESLSVKIKSLNDMICAEPTQVMTQKGSYGAKHAKLVRPSELVDTIKVWFYQNGIMVKRGPFRSCNTDSYNSFLADIMDGYFPSEFKDEYPDGVLFDLIDKRDIVYDANKTGNQAMSAQQLLQHLPKTVIRNGEVVDVRGKIASVIGPRTEQRRNAGDKGADDEPPSYSDKTHSGDCSKADKADAESAGVGHVVLCSANLAKHLLEKDEKADRGSKSRSSVESTTAAASSVCRVQVRWMDGSTVLVKVLSSAFVGAIRSLLVEHFFKTESSTTDSSSYPPRFELRCAWPSRTVSDEMSMQEAGLLPNGTLHAVKIK